MNISLPLHHMVIVERKMSFHYSLSHCYVLVVGGVCMYHVGIIVVCDCTIKGLWCIEIFSLVHGIIFQVWYAIFSI